MLGVVDEFLQHRNAGSSIAEAVEQFGVFEQRIEVTVTRKQTFVQQAGLLKLAE